MAPTIEGTPRELADRLGLLGAPVDELTELGAELGDILIARVTEVRPHGNADRLRVCTVEAGGEPLQVVCGAPNVEAGRFYPFAPVGATLPGGMKIGKAKIRDEVSEGMLCSARELGLGRDHAGIMTLAGEWAPGVSFVDSLEIDDALLVLDITPNRPDLLSHLGVARELAPGGVADLVLPAFPADDSTAAAATSGSTSEPGTVSGDRELSSDRIRITIEDATDCPRYMAGIVEGVVIGPSPEWLATRLRAIGVRPINNVVDATNYVLHEIGQPLHAFDLDRLAGPEIRVRRALAGETLRTLDGVERSLAGEALVIADRDRALALAGIMGGEESEVTSTTRRILVECALFEPLRVRKTARALGLSTDASHRFERGVDPELQPLALRRVLELIVRVAGGSIAAPLLDAHPAPAERLRLSLRPARVERMLGIALPAEEITALLAPIGIAVDSAADDALSVAVPSYRPDLTREIDVVEEIARRRGYDSFDAAMGAYRPGNVPADALLPVQEAMHELFGRWGFFEARTASFSPAADRRVPLLNALSAEESHLRDDLVTGLLRRVEHNWAHGVRAVRLYEMGNAFLPRGGPIPDEEVRLAAVFTGPSQPPHWSAPAEPWDVWDLKGLLAELAHSLDATLRLANGGGGDEETSLFVPGENLEIIGSDGRVIGTGGRVARGAYDPPAWADPLWAIELVLRPAGVSEPITFAALPAFPAVERDLALVLPLDTPAARVEEILRGRGGSLLEEFWPFDRYEGKGIPENTHSIAWRLRFRHPERTLTDAEVEAVVNEQLAGLAEELGVRRR